MRIGNLEDLDRTKKSENLENDKALEKAESQADFGKWKKWKNWWYYYKWYVVCGIVLFGIACNLIGSKLGLWSKAPDFQIAYVGKMELPQDTVSALEAAFSSIASDFNGDGEVVVQVNQYIDGVPNADVETAYYEYISETALIGDISACESYFFLMDDPARFQLEFQLLALPDGSCPEDRDYSVEDKTIAWTDCSILSQMELGGYSTIIMGLEQSGDNQELLSPLYIGRRCFYTDAVTKNVDKCSELWDLLSLGN